EHEDFLVANKAGVLASLTGELAVEVGERCLAVWINEKAGDAIQEVVPGGPGDRPALGQRLFGVQNLLHDDLGVRRACTQARGFLQRIAQAIRMVDAQAVDHTLTYPIEHTAMSVLEDLL